LIYFYRLDKSSTPLGGHAAMPSSIVLIPGLTPSALPVLSMRPYIPGGITGP